VYSVHDWAEVHRLHEREGCSKTAIARRLGMSRNTVDRLLRLTDPPTYERRSRASLLDPNWLANASVSLGLLDHHLLFTSTPEQSGRTRVH
jgi:transposase